MVTGDEITGRPAPGKKERDWTQGSIVGNLLSLSWPVIISELLNIVGPTIDLIWVGRLGQAAVAGVGVAGTAVMIVMSFLIGLSMGARALVARYFGAGDRQMAGFVAQQAFVFSGAFALVMAVIGILLAERFLVLLGLEPEVVGEGAGYLRIMLVGTVIIAFRLVTETVMQASGDTRTPLRISVLYRLFHVALVPFLIFGWWVFPRLGVNGAAVGNLFSQGLALGLGLWYLMTGRTRLRLTLRGLRVAPRLIWRIVRIGLPAAGSILQGDVAQLVIMWIMASFGTTAVAAHSIVRRVEMVLFMPAAGLGMGSGVLAGQNLGAGQPGRAERSGWVAAGVATATMVAGALVMLVWAEAIVGIFNTEPGLVATASAFLRIATLSYAVMGATIVFMLTLNGVGDTVPPLLILLGSTWLVSVPAAVVVGRFTAGGVLGVRWALASAMVVSTLAFIAYFRLGKWKWKNV